MRILLDNNVLVSGLLSVNGTPARLLNLWRRRGFELVTSRDQIERLAAVLARPKFRDRLDKETADRLIEELAISAIIVEPRRNVTASSDPEDNVILGTALAGEADYVVTGDAKHLLPLKQVESVTILSVHEAIDVLTKSTDDEAVN